jgi:DNA gyrase subunit B
MPELIVNGYLYIAQPPLFKVRKGKKVIYLKDEQTLSDYVLRAGASTLVVEAAPSNGSPNPRTISGDRLLGLLSDMERYSAQMRRVSRRTNGPVIESLLLHSTTRLSFLDRDELEPVMQHMREHLDSAYPEIKLLSLELATVEDDGGYALVGDTEQAGHRRPFRIDAELHRSREVGDLRRSLAQVKRIGAPPYNLISEDSSTRFGHPIALLQHIKQASQKGYDIQRYKGLGEMNPEQLWETTMDPGTRTLLQVSVRDAIGADEIFTILMGDEVEPRREFIQDNALDVRNLDV